MLYFTVVFGQAFSRRVSSCIVSMVSETQGTGSELLTERTSESFMVTSIFYRTRLQAVKLVLWREWHYHEMEKSFLSVCIDGEM